MENLEHKERYELTETILRLGIEKLCIYARDHGFLSFPYGRQPDPTPLISEEDFVNSGALQCDDEVPQFSYDYGFDPVKFLGDYLSWAHPESVAARRKAKDLSAERLRFRVMHAQRQLQQQKYLIERLQHLNAGIQWGPAFFCVSHSVLRCVAKPIRQGVFVMQFSLDPQFASILKTVKINIRISDDEKYLPVACYEISGLSPGTPCYLRCLNKPAEGNELLPMGKLKLDVVEVTSSENYGIDINSISEELKQFGQYSQAFTLPDPSTAESMLLDDEDRAFCSAPQKALTIRFAGQLPLDEISRVGYRLPQNCGALELDEALSAPLPQYVVLLGDLFKHPQEDHPDGALMENAYLRQLNEILCSLFRLHWLRSASLLLAWRDTSLSSSRVLHEEELAYKQFRQELRKYNKKHGIEEEKPGRKNSSSSSKRGNNAKPSTLPPPPCCPIPKGSPQINALLSLLPLYSESQKPLAQTTKMLFRAIPLTSDILLVLLDLRRVRSVLSPGCDYLGKEQAEWLSHTLSSSSHMWKIIACAKTFGAISCSYKEHIYENDLMETIVDADMSETINADVETKQQEFDIQGPNNNSLSEAEMIRLDSIGESLPEQPEVSFKRQSSTKQVQMMIPNADETESPVAQEGILHDDCDELFGRSKYSLQYILSRLQEKGKGVETKDDDSVLVAAPAFSGFSVITVSSGIILLTGGVTSAWISTVKRSKEGSSIDDILVSDLRDISSPCYVAGYCNLSESSQNGEVLCNTLTDSKSQDINFCAEVSLGCGTTSSDENQLRFIPGFEAQTFFLADDVENMNASAVPLCDVSLLTNGMLKISLSQPDFNEPKSSTESFFGRSAISDPIFECLFSLPVAQSIDDQSSTGDSVHIT